MSALRGPMPKSSLRTAPLFTLNKSEYKKANSASAKNDNAKRKNNPFSSEQLDFLKTTMNATAHMATLGNAGDEYIPGKPGPKSSKKTKTHTDDFIHSLAQSFNEQ